jgi:hypothetical protein
MTNPRAQVRVLRTGPPGPGWVLADPLEWAAGTTYLPNTVVEKDDVLYVSRSATTGDDPVSGGPWQAVPSNADAAARAGLARLRVDVTDFGAVGDGTTDDTDALKAAIASARATGQVVYLPPGTFRISAPLPFDVPLVGSLQSTTSIRALPGFVGSCMVDFTTPGESRYMSDLLFNANYVPGLNIFGATGAGSGAVQTFTRIRFWHTAADAYALTSDAGLVGSTFITCTWESCSRALNLFSNGGDDLTFIGCRFKMTPHSSQYPATAYMRLHALNHTFIGCYLFLGETTADHIISVGSTTTMFRGLFIEGATSAGVTHIFRPTNPSCNLTVEDVHFYVWTAAGLLGCIRGAVASGTGRYNLTARNWRVQGGSVVPPLFHILTTSPGNPALLHFSGCDDQDLLAFDPASSGTHLDPGDVRLHGTWRGMQYDHGARSDFGPTSLKPAVVDNPETFAAAVAASGTSPRTVTFTLPKFGIWLVTVAGKVNGTRDHMASGTWLVYYYDGINDTLATDQLGTTKLAAGGLATGMTLSAPTSAGVLTATLTFSSGPFAPLFACRMRQLNGFIDGWRD